MIKIENYSDLEKRLLAMSGEELLSYFSNLLNEICKRAPNDPKAFHKKSVPEINDLILKYNSSKIVLLSYTNEQNLRNKRQKLEELYRAILKKTGESYTNKGFENFCRAFASYLIYWGDMKENVKCPFYRWLTRIMENKWTLELGKIPDFIDSNKEEKMYS